MITVSKSQLKAKMLEYFRRVEQTGEELIVTNNRAPVLKVIPIGDKKDVAEVFADMRGKVKYYDDILTPETDEWGEV
ncbi:MAG: type II toxin-antitoxin system Phd/YefM family antitoxin [Candidatus Aminicenantes bacterium]|nr:type II toxin-antitoxin system Phd/YefM family antitoxin [Candidatus Aminicenantes bacterium]